MSDLHLNIVKCFAYISILIELSKGKQLSGYDLLLHLRTFGFKVSPGTLYHQLQMLRDAGILEGNKVGRKTVYKMTDQGMDMFDVFKKNWKPALKYVYQHLE